MIPTTVKHNLQQTIKLLFTLLFIALLAASCGKQVPTRSLKKSGEAPFQLIEPTASRSYEATLGQASSNTETPESQLANDETKQDNPPHSDHDFFRHKIHPDKKIPIALLLPMSGTHAKLGQALQDAAQLALFDIQSTNIELLLFDTKGTPIGAKRAARKALNRNVQLILGPVFSESTRVVAPIAYKHDVNLLSFSNDQSLTEEGIFILGFLPDQQIKRVVEYATRQGIQYYADIVPNNAYGAKVSRQLRDMSQIEGISVVKSEFYAASNSTRRNVKRAIKSLLRIDDDAATAATQDYRAAYDETPFSSIENAPYNKALLIPEGGEQLKNIAATLSSVPLTEHRVKILGSGQWDGQDFSSIPNLHGSWYASAEPQSRLQFETHFNSTYGYQPIRLASLAYDAVALTATLAYSYKYQPFSHSSITHQAGFSGVDGIFRLTPTGICERGLAILEISENGRRIIDPAPVTFQ